MPITLPLRPFFPYFGSKWRLARSAEYAAPQYDTIIEPFAGSAGYALNHANKSVILYDRDPVIVGVWKFLLAAEAKEILALPDILPGSTIDDYNLCQEQRWFVGFWLNKGMTRPCRTPSAWVRSGLWPNSNWGQMLRTRIATQLHAIRHWQVFEQSYEEAPLQEATWFVDPPYQTAGRHYRCGSRDLNYTTLASWCAELPGQAIVCESAPASWLPFRNLVSSKTSRANRCSELVWENNLYAH